MLLQFYVSSGLEQGDRTAFLFGFSPLSVPLALACSKLPSAEELLSVAGVQTDRTCLCKWQAPCPQCVFADAGTRLMLSTAAVTAVGFEPTPSRTSV